MTSSALTATCPSAPEIGMLVLQRLHGVGICRTAARKRQMRAPRGCFTPGCVPQHRIFSTGFSRSQTPRPRTVSYGQRPFPYNTSTINLLVEREWSPQTILFTSINAPRSANATHQPPQGQIKPSPTHLCEPRGVAAVKLSKRNKGSKAFFCARGRRRGGHARAII